jgi:LPXTG-motif cell wall-anchored protein
LSATDTAMTRADTLVSTAPTSSATAHTTTTFSNGAVAPNTATSLPTLLVVGLLSLAAGLLLLRRRRAS